MGLEELTFINDVIQDTRVDARIEAKYNAIINLAFRNIKLNWNKEGLTLKTDDKIINLIEALEPERYQNALNQLKANDLVNSEENK